MSGFGELLVGVLGLGIGYTIGTVRARKQRAVWLATERKQASTEAWAKIQGVEGAIRRSDKPRQVLAQSLADLDQFLMARAVVLGDLRQDAITYLESTCTMTEQDAEARPSRGNATTTLQSAPAPAESDDTAASLARAKAKLRDRLRP